MIYSSITLPVNQHLADGEIALTREQMWRGIKMKVRDARLFLPPGVCTACEVIDESDDHVLREAVIMNTDMKEYVALEPGSKATFHQIKGPWEGIIVNELFDDDAGDLQLRFYCLLGRIGAEPGGEEEQRDQAMFEGDKGYRTALMTTIAKTRELLQDGNLQD